MAAPEMDYHSPCRARGYSIVWGQGELYSRAVGDRWGNAGRQWQNQGILPGPLVHCNGAIGVAVGCVCGEPGYFCCCWALVARCWQRGLGSRYELGVIGFA